MNFETFTKVIDSIAEYKLAKKIQLHVLGEPLLYKDIVPAVRHATDKGLKVMLTTNGSLLTREKILELSDAGLYSVDISLQLYDSARHETRASGIDFATYRKCILDAIGTIHTETDMQLIVKLMNTKYKKLFTFERPIDLVQQGEEFKSVVLRLIKDISKACELGISDAQVENGLNTVNLDAAKRLRLAENLFVFVQLFMDWGNAFSGDKVHPVKFGNCSFAFTSPSVLCDGTVTICCGDFDGGTRIGNIHDAPLQKILQSEKVKQLWAGFQRNRLPLPYCQRCLGGRNFFLAMAKGVGSILAAKFMNLEGGNVIDLNNNT